MEYRRKCETKEGKRERKMREKSCQGKLNGSPEAKRADNEMRLQECERSSARADTGSARYQRD